jgi:hypothetical protein
MDRSDAGTLNLELLHRQHGAALLLFALAMTGERIRARMLCIRFTPHSTRMAVGAVHLHRIANIHGMPRGALRFSRFVRQGNLILAT